MRPMISVRVDVEETDRNGAYRWLVVMKDNEAPEHYRHTVYGALTEEEAVEVSHAVASAVVRMHQWMTEVREAQA